MGSPRISARTKAQYTKTDDSSNMNDLIIDDLMTVLTDKKWYTKKRIALILIIIIFGGLIGFNILKKIMLHFFFAHYTPPAIAVSSAMSRSTLWHSSLPAVGNFVAVHGVDVNAQVGGNITAVHFKSGELVTANQPLVDLDDTIEQATLKFNQANLTLQATNYKRQLDLFKKNATSASSVDDAKALLLQAQANVEKTQAVINQKHIRAPFFGALGINQINLGQYIKPGETPIVSLQSLDPMYLNFYCPEQWMEKLHINQIIKFSIEQNPNIKFIGKITAINSKIDTNTHTIKVQATVANCPTEALKDPLHSPLVHVTPATSTEAMLVACDTVLNQKKHVQHFNFTPGMFSSIQITQPSQKNVITVPTTAISFTLYGNSVFLIEKSDDPAILSVRRVFVSTGEQQGNDTVITKGLEANKLIVAVGELKLENGTHVTINNTVALPAHNPASLSP